MQEMEECYRPRGRRGDIYSKNILKISQDCAGQIRLGGVRSVKSDRLGGEVSSGLGEFSPRRAAVSSPSSSSVGFPPKRWKFYLSGRLAVTFCSSLHLHRLGGGLDT